MYFWSGVGIAFLERVGALRARNCCRFARIVRAEIPVVQAPFVRSNHCQNSAPRATLRGLLRWGVAGCAGVGTVAGGVAAGVAPGAGLALPVDWPAPSGDVHPDRVPATGVLQDKVDPAGGEGLADGEFSAAQACAGRLTAASTSVKIALRTSLPGRPGTRCTARM